MVRSVAEDLAAVRQDLVQDVLPVLEEVVPVALAAHAAVVVEAGVAALVAVEDNRIEDAFIVRRLSV